MRAIVPAVIVLILVLGGLLAYRMNIRSTNRTAALKSAEARADLAETVVAKVRKELSISNLAKRPLDEIILGSVLGDYDMELETHKKKGIIL